jgi:hypothetical protein
VAATTAATAAAASRGKSLGKAEADDRVERNIVQEGLPDAIPLEACYLGWQESLRNLAKLVEPEINQ